MEIKQIKHYLKRVGPEEFVIGENVLDPLVWVSGHNVIVDGVYTQYISGAEAWGWGGPSEFGFASSGNLFISGKDLSDDISSLSGQLNISGSILSTRIDGLGEDPSDHVTHDEAIAYAIIFG